MYCARVDVKPIKAHHRLSINRSGHAIYMVLGVSNVSVWGTGCVWDHSLKSRSRLAFASLSGGCVGRVGGDCYVVSHLQEVSVWPRFRASCCSRYGLAFASFSGATDQCLLRTWMSEKVFSRRPSLLETLWAPITRFPWRRATTFPCFARLQMTWQTSFQKSRFLRYLLSSPVEPPPVHLWVVSQLKTFAR